MIVGKNHEISCYGEGRDGWMSFLQGKMFDLKYTDKKYDANYATGVYVDVTIGLFAFDSADLLNTFVKEDGTYGTGVCRDYNMNWMLRRSLWTDADGTEHVAEGTVTAEGRILDPISIKEYKYSPNTVYPLTGSWSDMWFLYVDDDDRYSEDMDYNLVVPLSFFEYLQHHYGMYSFGELSSRTFQTKIYPQINGDLVLVSLLEHYWDYDDYPFDIDDMPMYVRALISMDGEILEPLHIDIPKYTTRECYVKAYKNYLDGIANKPQPW